MTIHNDFEKKYIAPEDIIIHLKYPKQKKYCIMVYSGVSGKFKAMEEGKMSWWERICEH